MSKARDLANAGTALGAVSATELGYVDGVTSAIQTQMDAKLATATASSTYIPKTLTTTTGDIIYASGANTPARLGIGTSGQGLQVVAGVPTWSVSSTSALTTTGDLLYASAANTLARRGIGTTGQVLTVTGGVPTWATAPASTDSWTLLNAGGTALTGAATVTVSGISGKEKLFVLVKNASSSVQSTISLRVNTLTTSIYYPFGMQNQALSTYTVANIVSDGSADGTAMNQLVLGQMSTDTGSSVSGYCLITGCSSSTNVKMYQASGAGNSNTGNNATSRSFGGYIDLTSAITSISVSCPGGGSLDAGTVYVYANS